MRRVAAADEKLLHRIAIFSALPRRSRRTWGTPWAAERDYEKHYGKQIR
jgi:hypothetical protein